MHDGDGVVTLGIEFRSQIAYRVKCMDKAMDVWRWRWLEEQRVWLEHFVRDAATEGRAGVGPMTVPVLSIIWRGVLGYMNSYDCDSTNTRLPSH